MKKKLILLLFLLAAFLLSSNAPVEAEQTNPQTDQWVQRADLPKPLTSAATAAVHGKIYTFGGTSRGTSEDKTYVYDPESNTWAQKKSMPQALTSASVAVVDEKVYIIGGITWSSDGKYNFSKSVLVYDTQSDAWETETDIPINIADNERPTFSTATVVDKKIYVMGGSYDLASANYCYDTESKTWSKKKDLPQPTSGATLQTINGKIYLIGGGDTINPNQKKIYNTIYEYDPKGDTWLKKHDLISGRQYSTSTVLDGKIYIMGGRNGGGGSSIVQVYDPKDDSISQMKSFYKSRAAAGAATIGKSIYVIGGQSSEGTISDARSDVLNSVEMYTVETSSKGPETPEEPTKEQKGKRAILVITMTTGLEKEFDLSMEEVNDFISWYDQKAAGTGPARYAIDKHENNIGPFNNRKDHVIFDKILTFEVNEYSSKKAE
ncbi:DUF1668 domain-containing protein [Bacillus sonorensis]|uniref:Kelch repeat-containing protein n=1 Tax=Bacillus sonorensis TaxID=119858 RepID=UPI002DB69CD1|nr:DUF1668 domain-containing protein [Bacillus sonorensis]MEC1537615.1 DUF1668 domain-containing protein [Bacillus sonorensis]